MRRLIVSILIIGATCPTFAFDGHEHARVSGNAFRIARAHWLRHAPLSEAESRTLDEFDNSVSQFGYGQLVVSIDHRIDPLKIFEKALQREPLPTDVSDLDPRVLKRALGVDLSALRAAASNETHFQSELTTNLRLWHYFAVQTATYGEKCNPGERCGNLFLALMLNSFADHYLEDFFVPGHILTPRYGLHDAVALAMHDQFNIIGTAFILDREAIKRDLAPLLDDVPNDVLESIHASPELIRAFRSGDLGDLTMWGDSNLKRSPTEELLITLVVSRSILDIFESYETSEPVNHLSNIQFVNSRLRQFGKRDVSYGYAQAVLPYGYHTVPESFPSHLWFPSVVELYAGPTTLSSEGRVSSRLEFGADKLVVGVPPFWPDTHHYLDLPGEKDYLLYPSPVQFGLTLGVSFAYNGNETVYGPHSRLIIAFPMIHSQIGIEGDLKRYELHKGRSETAGSYGIRFQTGFSLLSLHLGVARDHVFADGDLRPATAIHAAIGFSGPALKLPLIGRVERRRLERDRNAYYSKNQYD